MKLLICKKCSDIFSLTYEIKTCGCGEAKGLYVDDLNANISGDCTPIGFQNTSIREALAMQMIEDKNQPPLKSTDCCPQGVRFEAFFIPEVARSITRVSDCSKVPCTTKSAVGETETP